MILGTLIHPGVLRSAHELLGLSKDLGGHWVLPIFNQDEDYLCLDYRPARSARQRQGGGGDFLTNNPAVVFIGPEVAAPVPLWKDTEMLLERMGLSIPA